MRTINRLAGAAVAVTIASGALASAGPQAPQRSPGLYVIKGDGTAVRFDLQTASVETKGMGKAAFTMGISRPSSEVRLFGPRADVRVPAGKVTFHLHLPSTGAARDPMAYAEVAGSVPLHVRRPNDIALVRLSSEEETDERVANLGSMGSSRARNAIDLAVARIANAVFQLETKAPLTPGEYVFVSLPTGASEEVWDFGVDAE